MRMDSGLIIELWTKGMLWDKLLGTHWLPLRNIKHSNQVEILYKYCRSFQCYYYFNEIYY